MRASDVLLTSTLRKRKKGRSHPISIDLILRKGTSTALLSSEQSGSKRVIHCLLGLIPATSGELFVMGEKWNPGMKRKLGVALCPNGFFERLTVRDNLNRHCDVFRISKSTVEANLKAFGLEEAMDSIVQNLSKSMRQRLNLARALLGSPRILILENPFYGLDTLWKTQTREILQERLKEGAVLLWTSSNPKEVEMMADSVQLIENGSTIDTGDSSLLNPIGCFFEIRCQPLKQAMRRLEQEKKVLSLRQIDLGNLRVQAKQADIEWLRERLKKEGITIGSCKEIKASIDRLFPDYRKPTAKQSDEHPPL